MAGSVSVDGLISGLDTKGIIEQLIAIQRSRVTALTDKQKTQTQKASIFQTLSANYLGIRTAASALKSPSLFNQRSATSSNTNILAATASDKAALGSSQFTVLQLATSHQFLGSRFADKTTSTGVTGDLKITVGEGSTAITTTVTLTGTNNTLQGIQDAINGSGAKVKASIVQVDNSKKPYRLSITAKDPGSAGKVSISFNNSSFVSTVTDEQAGPGAEANTAATADTDGKTLSFATARPNLGTAVTVKIGATAGTAAIIQPKLAAPAITSVQPFTLTTVTDEQAGTGAGTATSGTDDGDGKTFAFVTGLPDPGSSVTVKLGATAGTAATIQATLATPTLTNLAPTSGGGTLPSDTIIYYKVAAIDSSGETLSSQILSQTTTGGGNNEQMQVTWSTVEGATAYRLYASLDPNNFGASSLVTQTASTTVAHTTMTLGAGTPVANATQGYTLSFETGTVRFRQAQATNVFLTYRTDSPAGGSLPSNTTIYYKVAAIDGSGETLASATASALTSSSGNNEQVTVNWGAIAGASGYRLYASLDPNNFGGASLVTQTGAGTTSFTHTSMALSAGSPLATATQGYTIDLETGAVKFNQAQYLSSRTADTAATVRGGDGTATDANRFTIDFAFKEDGTALASGPGSSAEAMATLLKSAGLVAESAGSGKIEIDLATDSFDTTAKLTVTTKNSGFTTLDQLVGAINNSSLGKVLKAENASGSLKLTAQFNGVYFKAADADFDTAEAGTPNTGFDNAATLSAAASKVFLSYQHGGLIFSESQAVQDAIIRLGAGDSAVTVTKNSNTITDLIEGVTLDLKKADAETAVTVNVTRSALGVTSAVSSLVDAINQTEAFIQEQSFFEATTNETGPLFADSNLFIARSRVSGVLTGIVESVPLGKLRALEEVGISLSPDTGNYSLDSAKLSSLLNDKPDEVRDLFASVAESSDIDIEALTFTDKTKTSTSAGYGVVITQAADRAEDEGAQNVSAGLTQNETLTITTGGLTAGVSLTSGMTAEQATSAINSALQGAGITTLTAVFSSTTGKITVRHNSYGSKFSFTIKSTVASGTAGSTGLGSATANSEAIFTGQDVAGTISGEAATGDGQTLTANAGNATTEGLQLLVKLTPEQLAEQGSSQGSVRVSRGVSSRLEELLAFLTDPSQEGPIESAIKEANKRVEDFQSQIDTVSARIERERLRLSEQFARLEQALGTLQTTSTFLNRQLEQISANSASIAKSRS